MADVIALDKIGLPEDDHFTGRNNYFAFMANFKRLTKSLTDDGIKMGFLRKWCKGIAKDAISSTIWKEQAEPSQALAESLSILEKRFGQAHRLADQLVKSLTEGKACENTGDSYYSLVHELQNAQASASMVPGGLFELKSAHFIRSVMLNRAPLLMKEWMKKSDAYIENGVDITIDHLIQFLTRQAEMLNGLYGLGSYEVTASFISQKTKGQSNVASKKEAKKTKNNPASNPKGMGATEIQTADKNKSKNKIDKNNDKDICSSASRDHIVRAGKPNDDKNDNKIVKNDKKPQDDKLSVRHCIFCQTDGHLLYQCLKFKGEKIDDRMKFIQDRELCRVCFKSNHSHDDCTFNKIFCRHCGDRHNSLLHGASLMFVIVKSNQNGAAGVQPIEQALVDPDMSGSRPVISFYVISKKTGEKVEVTAMMDCGSDAN